MRFLGTGAAELIPNPFCDCPICAAARRDPAERRLRSCFYVDAHTMIDFGPDALAALNRYGLSLDALDDVLVTHAHEDHFSVENLSVITMRRTKPARPYTVHLSREAYKFAMDLAEALRDITGGRADLARATRDGWLRFAPHDAFMPFEMGKKRVLPVRGNHTGATEAERSLNYRIEWKGKTFLYALDTGLYAEETLEALKGRPLDALIMDATFGSAPLSVRDGHLNGENFLKQVEALRDVGAVTDETRIYATHINHKHAWNHRAYQDFFDASSEKVTVARDGMEVDF